MMAPMHAVAMALFVTGPRHQPTAVTQAVLWSLAAVLLSAMLWLALRKRGWGAAAGWVALALAGQACAVQLLEVAKIARPQMLWGWSVLLRTWRIGFLLVVVIEAGVVAWAIWRDARQNGPLARSLRGLLTAMQLILLLLMAAFACAALPPEVMRSLFEGGFAPRALNHSTKVLLGLTVLFGGAGSLALAAANAPENVAARLAAWWREGDRSRLVYAAAAFVVLFGAFFQIVVLERLPHVPDEAAYIFQARYLAEGRLWLPVPPDPEAIPCPFIIVDNGKWYGAPPLGWPVALSLGYRIGLPWLVNPLLGGLSVLLLRAFLRRIYDAGIADAAALLLAASPFHLYLSSSLMPHALSLVLLLLGFLGVERARNAGSAAWGLVAGLSIGAMIHVRLLEPVVAAVVLGAWWLAPALAEIRRGMSHLETRTALRALLGRRLRIAPMLATLAGGLAMLALLLAYNKTMTGDAFRNPINVFADQKEYPGANRLGFGPDIGNFGWSGLDPLPGHGPLDVLYNSNHNSYLMNFDLFGWACGSLLFVGLLLAWREWKPHALMWAFLMAFWCAISLYWFSGGPDFGPRYWYPMIVPLVALTAAALPEAARRMGLRHAAGEAPLGRVALFALLASSIGLVVLMPWRALDKYHEYRGVTTAMRVLAAEKNFGKSIVVIRGNIWPEYSSAVTENPALYDPAWPGPVFIADRGEESLKKMKASFPGRAIWVVAAPSVTGAGFEVVAGPQPGE
jgi:hypothetical protein